jgi:hypothetical protein
MSRTEHTLPLKETGIESIERIMIEGVEKDKSTCAQKKAMRNGWQADVQPCWLGFDLRADIINQSKEVSIYSERVQKERLCLDAE